MHKKAIPFLVVLSLLFPAVAFAQTYSSARQMSITRSLDMFEKQKAPVVSGIRDNRPYDKDNSPAAMKDFIFKNAIGAVSFGVTTSTINGSTKYRISFDNPYEVGGHGESELKWPINTALFGVSAGLHYRRESEWALEHDRCRLGLKWLAGSSKKPGDMKDSDWIQNDVGYIDYDDDGVLNGSSAWATNNDGLDIYSESPAKMEGATLFDINYVYNLWIKDKWALGPMLGYYYQHFKFTVHSLNQMGYGPYAPGLYDMSYQDTGNRKWGEYEATYHVPYIGVNSELNLNDRFALLFNLGFSDWVRIKDRDSHLYPTTDEALGYNYDMLSPGRSKGKAFLFGGAGSWRFSPGWFLNLSANYMSMDTKGHLTQQQYADGALISESAPIDEAIKSHSWLLSAGLRHSF